MKTFYWLLKREFWEHRGGFLWAPIVTGAIFLVLNVMAIITAEVLTARHGMHFGGGVDIQTMIRNADAGDWQQVGAAADIAMISSVGLIGIVMGIVVLFYCLGSLYDDRRDRSVLFWKSLPISNTHTVLSKVASAAVVAPVIAVVVSIVCGLLQLLIFAVVLSFHGINVWQLLGLSHPLRAVGSLLSNVPLYGLWALPAVGWLMLCSAAARSKPFLWAVAVPVVLGLLVTWFGIMGLFNLSTGWFWVNIVQRALLSVFPGSNLVFGEHSALKMGEFADSDPLAVLSPMHTYSLLASPDLWIGVIAGLALIAGAIWFRRVRDDS
jgi:ABC-2 type transport system permease protein